MDKRVKVSNALKWPKHKKLNCLEFLSPVTVNVEVKISYPIEIHCYRHNIEQFVAISEQNYKSF